MRTNNRSILSDLWKMRQLSISECLSEIENNSDLKFLLTVAGCWWVLRLVFTLTVTANIIYYLCRLFKLVVM